MNIEKLRMVLGILNVPPKCYEIDGNAKNSDRYALEKLSTGEWATYFEERGVKGAYKIFNTENEACAHLLVLILKDSGVVDYMEKNG